MSHIIIFPVPCVLCFRRFRALTNEITFSNLVVWCRVMQSSALLCTRYTDNFVTHWATKINTPSYLLKVGFFNPN